MKVMKKLAAVVLTICLAVPAFGAIVYAADGRLSFSDPETKVGENVSVNMAVRTGEGNIGEVSVNLSYDTDYLEFVSGEGFEADGEGGLTFTGTGDGQELLATMEFRALQTGEASITVEESTATMESGDDLNLTEGSSKIAIEAADDGSTTAEPEGTAPAGETTDIAVQVNGTEYHFSEAFTSSDIPSGYAETTLNFQGADHRFAANDKGVYLGYLVDGSGNGSFFLYDAESSSFAPYVELNISTTTSIILLNEPDQVSLPDNYQEVNLTVLNQQFPSWSNGDQGSRFCLIYALNTRTGEKGLYQYDTSEGTYQSYTVAAQNESTEITLEGKLGELIDANAVMIILVLAALILILLILMIIFAVKLVHRNQELDDLYDEYDIPFDDEEEEVVKPEPVKPAPKQQKKKKVKVVVEEDDEDDYDEDDDDDYYDDDYEDDDDDYYDDDDDYDDDDYYDDDEEEEEVRPRRSSRSGKSKNKKKSKRSSKNEDYEMDFVDL